MAYQKTYAVTDHGSYVSYINLHFNANGTLTGEVADVTGQLAIQIHGWALWAAWGILGLVQIASNRYLKVFWKVHMWIHRIGGTLIFLITIALSIVGIW